MTLCPAVEHSDSVCRYSDANITVVVDAVPPTCSPILPLDANGVGGEAVESAATLYSSVTTGLRFQWNCSDQSPGRIESTQWAVGTSPGSWDVMAWADARAEGVHESNITLLSGDVVFVSVRATDSAGLSILRVSAPLFIDDAPPLVVRPASLVNNATDRSTAFWGVASYVHGTWAFSDPHTGVVSVFTAVLGVAEPAPDLSAMAQLPRSYRTGCKLETGEALQHGVNYQLLICATDRLLHSSCSPPAFFITDLTPPSCTPPEERFAGDDTPGPYFGVAGAISANWTCSDAESSVVKSEWSVVTVRIANRI